VSAAAAPRPTLAGAVARVQSVAPAGATSALGAREAALRSAATACLTGIALIEAIALPAVLARGATPSVLVLAAIALCVGDGLALVAATASAAPKVWRAVAATGAVVLAGWALPHAVSLPQAAGARGDWAAMPGVACAALAAACLVLAGAAVRPTRGTARALAVALAVLVAWAPGAVAVLVATGPAAPGGETGIATSGVGAHAASPAREPDIVLRPGATGNHYVIRLSRPRRAPAAGVALLAVAAAAFAGGAVASLRRRSGATG
jgi:hypothetical protein